MININKGQPIFTMKKAKKIKRVAKKERKEFPVFNIKVIGVGGGGSHIVSRMSKDFVRGVNFIVVNTDLQDLEDSAIKQKISIGRNLTRGLGTGMNPELGRQAAEENRSEIAEALKGADMVFLAAGMSGGTGTGAIPVIAETAKQLGALTIAFVTKPFQFEGSQRERIAQEGIAKLKDKVDAMIVVPNERIFTVISKDTPIIKAFEAVDEVLKNTLRGIVELILTPGIINVDFADVRTIIQDAGSAIVGVGAATGAERAVNAVNSAMNSPLLEVNAEGAKGVILGIAGGRDLRMTEINEAAKLVAQAADPGAKIIFGAYHDRQLKQNQIKITVIATGFNGAISTNSLFANHLNSKGALGLGKTVYAEEAEAKTDHIFKPQEERAATTLASASFLKDKEKEVGAGNGANGGEKEESAWDMPTFLRRRRK